MNQESASGVPPGVTLAETIRVGLADEITSGALAPGTEIDEQAVARRFGASRTPVREALRALASSGLVVLSPRRGVRVAALTSNRLGELFELMAETEALCIRLATYRMTAVERVALQMLHQQSARTVELDDIDRYDQQNIDFHTAIYHASHNSVLADHAVALRLRLAPFRRAQFRGELRLRQSHAEHEAIIAQVLQGDGEAAGRLMRAHMLTASAALAAYLGGSGRGA
ncbi:MAG TPA: GntR family transcriptional regulator [Acetobacteraceae bacterium]|nr:GntR family transcriptional regulator [Acetobacteraceae bacterium]